MAHLDSSSWDDGPESGYPVDGDPDSSYPPRHAPRHARHAPQGTPSTADYWDTPPTEAVPEYPGRDGRGGAARDAPAPGYSDAPTSGYEVISPGGGPFRDPEVDAGQATGEFPVSGPPGTRRVPRPLSLPGPPNLHGTPGPPGAHGAAGHLNVPGPPDTPATGQGPVPGDPAIRRRHSRDTQEAEPEAPSDTGPQRVHRSGRNLPVAIGVGLLLGGTVLASLLLWRPAFVGVVIVAVAIATWEIVRAVRTAGMHPPLVPLLAGGPVMAGLAWFGGADVLTLGLVATALAVAVWRIGDGAEGYQRDVTIAIFIATYVPFLGSFAVLLDRPADGAARVLAMLIAVVVSDTCGLLFGVLFGRHPMAPSVSPKKSWEGLCGSLISTAAAGGLLAHYMLHANWRLGVLFGLAVSAAAVFGDLAESMLKRDLKIKDMSTLLPGHGGLMDRVDSILLAAPTAYAVLSLLVSVRP